MKSMIGEFLFPGLSEETQKIIDEDSIRNIEYISVVIAFFEIISLACFALTRKRFGPEEWVAAGSVLFCVIVCSGGYLFAKAIRSEAVFSHRHVLAFKAIYYMLISTWAIWASYRQYSRGEQMLTFYAVEVILVCFILMKPWLSAMLTALVYGILYAVLCSVDGGAGVNIINYAVLAVVSVIGVVVRYHSSIGMAETTVQLQKAKDTEIRDKINTLQAMSDIYDNVNLIDFTDNTEMALRDKNHTRRRIDLGPQTHTYMTQRLRERVMPDQLERFIEYTNITTVRARLMGRKLLSDDFIDVVDGWIRAQYIPVEYDESGVPQRVIFTTRNVDDEKRREERLLRIAMTDELTRLPNRRSYEEDLMECGIHGFGKDFVLLCADVNGLKRVNDTIGHVAGDELIMGAAECLLLAIGSKGKVYRTGGDEFMAILHTEEPEKLCGDIASRSGEWRGQYSREMSISVGYASQTENNPMDIRELQKRADEEMYRSKERYYREKGIDRRRNRRA